MEREYVRGNKEHWREIFKWAFGEVPYEGRNIEGDYLTKDTCVMIKRHEGRLFCIDSEDEEDKALYDVVTTNPYWHEVKPWEKHYDPKPFDKVLGWDDDDPADIRPDIFLYKRDVAGETLYYCASGYWGHVKPYDEKEYTEHIL